MLVDPSWCHSLTVLRYIVNSVLESLGYTITVEMLLN